MTRLASRPEGLRRTRADLMAKSALYGALTGAFGLVASSQAQAGTGPPTAVITGLPVQAPTAPLVAGGPAGLPQITVSGSGGSNPATMVVQTNASRTLIDWNSFTVAQGNAVNFTFNTRSDIVLNRLVTSAPVVINGGVTGTVQGSVGGNVWFSAPGGVVFGSTAVVNVGGLLATTALVDVNSFLNASNTSSFPFTYPGMGYPGTTGYAAGTYSNGSTYPAGPAYPAINAYPTSNVAGGVGGVTVQAGARLTAQGGLMALIAPFVNVAAGATVQSTDQTPSSGGAGSVLYGSANAFTVSLSQETSGDLDMLQFVIDSPTQVTDTPLLLQGTTTGTNIYVAALTASGITGAVVDATGSLTATTASTGQGGEIILSTGADTINAGQAPAPTTLATGALQLNLDDATAGADLRILSSSGINASADPNGLLQSTGDMTLSAAGDISLANVSAGGNFTATATTTDQYGDIFGVGAVTANSVAAFGSVDLEGSSVTAATVTSYGAGVTANAYDTPTSSDTGLASVDIGSVAAVGDINLTAVDGYASLTNVTFNGGGQNLNITADGSPPIFGGPSRPVYVGYSQGGPGANNGAGPTGAVGTVAGTGTINLNAGSDADLDVATGSGLVTVGSVNAGGVANLTADALTITGVVQSYSGANATARTGDLNAQELDALYGDVNANATLGSVFLANATANDVYVTAAQTAHLDNANTNGGPSDPIDVTGATAYLGTANSQNDINVTATNGSATAGDLTAQGSVTVTATNGVASLHSATLSSGTSYPSGATYPNTVSVSATGSGADVLIGDPAGTSATGFITGAISITASADEDVTVNVAQPIELSSVSVGRNLTLTAPSLTLDSLQGALAGDVAIDVFADAFTYTTALTAGGAVNIAASGALTLGDVTGQGGPITLGGAGITAGALNAGADIGLTSSGGDIVLGGDAMAGGGFSALAVNGSEGLGAVSVGNVTASGRIDLEGSSVRAASLTTSGADANGLSVTAFASDPAEGAGAALVDIGAVSAPGDIQLTANDGYASLSSVAFTGSGQTLSLTSHGGDPVYLGYSQQNPDIQGPPTGAVGGVTGSGTINLASDGDVNADVNTALALNSVTAAGEVTLAAAGVLSLTTDLTTGGDIAVNAPGQITLANLTSTGGSVTLTGGGGVSFGTGSASQNFIATAITGAPGSGSGPGTGTGAINGGSISATSGYIDVEGTDVSVGDLTAGGVSDANSYAIYAAAWGGSGASSGALSYGGLSPAYDTGQVFLYPAPPPPPPAVALPTQDTSSPFQFDSQGAAPTIGAPAALADGDTGETITLNAKRTLIDWTSYQIGAGGEVDYAFNPVEGQNAANARGNIVLNRITGGAPVDVEGVLTSTVVGDTQPYGGNVWFSAPGGVVFGSGAVVNVGGLLATTAGFSPANLTRQFLDPTVFTFTLAGAGTGYPSGASGFPGGSGYPDGAGYANATPFNGDAGVAVEGGAQISSNGGLLALLGPYVDVAAGAQVSGLDPSQTGVASVLYAAAPSYTLTTTQPLLGGDTTNGQGDLGFASLAIGTGDLSGYATPLDLEGVTSASNIYAAALSPSQVSGAAAIATGALTAQSSSGQSSSGAAGEIILSTGADTIAAGQTPTPSTAAIGAVQLNLDTLTASGALRILSSGGINASADPNGLLQSGGDLSLAASGDISLASVNAGGSFTATSTATSQDGVFGTGAVSANSVTAGGSVDLEGSSVTANSLTAGSGGGLGAITATAYDTATSPTPGTASVDIGSASATGDITLTANDGYASLTSVAFNGAGQTLALDAYGFEPSVGYDPTYLGYSSGGPDANGGAGPTGGVGAVTGLGAASASINLFAYGDVDADLSGAATLNTVTSTNNTVNLAADSLTITGVAQGYYGVNATARTGDLNADALESDYGDVNATANQGSVYLTSAVATFFGDVNVNATQGSVFLTNASANDVYVTAAQTAHVDTATTQGVPSDPIDVTGATAYLGTASSQDDINLTATNGSATAGDLTALGAITITATNGSASLHSATLSPGTSSSGTAYPNTVSLSATGSGADVLIGDALGAPATGFVTGATSFTASADQDVTVNVDAPITLNTVSAGRTVSLTAPSLTLGSLQGTLTGDIGIDVTDDGFSYTDPLTAGGGLTIASTGALNLGALTAQSAGISLVGGSVSTGAVSANASTGFEGPVGAYGATSGATAYLGVYAEGTGLVSNGSVVAGSGSVTLASVDTGGRLSVQADGPVTVTGTTQAVGVYAFGNGPVSFGDAVTTTGDLVDAEVAPGYSGDVTATTITSAGGLTLVSPTGAITLGQASAGAGDLTLSAPSGALNLSGALSSAQGGVFITGGQGLTLDQTLTAAGGITVSVPGALSLGDLSSQGYVELTAGSVSAGAVSATTANGGVYGYLGDEGNPQAQYLPLGVAITASGLNGGSGVTPGSGTVSLASVNTALPAAVTAEGAVNIPGTVQASAGSIYAGGAITLGAAVTASAGDLDLEAGSGGAGDLQGATVSSAGRLQAGANGGALSLTGATASGGDLVLGSTGALNVGSASASGDITLTTSDGSVTLGGADFLAGSPGVLTLNAGGADTDLSISNAAVFGDAQKVELSAGRDVSVDVTGALPLDTVSAGRDATLAAGGAISVNSLTAGRDATVSGTGAGDGVSVASANVAGNLTLASAGDADLVAYSVGGGLSLTGTTVELAPLPATVGGDLTIGVTAGGFSYGQPITAVGAVNIGASGALQLADVTGQTGPVSLAGSSVSAGAVSAGGSGEGVGVYANASAGDLSFTGATTAKAGAILVNASGQVALGDVAAAAGAVQLNGGTGVSLGTGSAAGDFVATALAAGYGPGAGTVADPSHGSGPVTAGSITATNGYIDLEGTDVSVGALTSGSANFNGYATYAAAWGADGGGGALGYGALSPTYDTGQVFLYPAPPPPPPAVALPTQDTSSPFQFDSLGAAPTIGAPAALADGDTGETITLNARRTLIDWTSYQIGAGGEVDYAFNPVEGQNAANARGNIVLNRITGGAPVDVEGVLTSTVVGDTQPYGGNVWFSAPGGVVFGSGAVVNVGGLLATTAGFSPANLTRQFLDPTVFTFTLAGAGTGYPSGASGFPGGSGYPDGAGYANATPFNGDAGVAVEGGAQISSNGGLLALLGPYVDVAAGAQVSGLDPSQTGVASVLYAAAPSYTLTTTQPLLGGDTTNGQGDLGFASLAIGTGDLSGYATPLDLEGVTSASNIYAAALSPSQVSGAAAIATGALTAQSSSGQSSSATAGEIILSTGADTIAAGQTPTPSTAAIGAVQLNLDTLTASGALRILSSGGINASADPNGLLQSGGDLSLAASGDISLASVNAGGSFTATSTASVDIGSATAAGDIDLDAGYGYASLTNVTFSGSGQTLTLTSGSGPAYFGYGSGGPGANDGAGPTAGVGSVTGSGTLDFNTGGDADLNVAGGSGLVTIGSVTAAGAANLTADALTITGIVNGYAGANVTARTGDLNASEIDSVGPFQGELGDVNANAMQGSVFLANTTGANVYVTAAQTAHVDNATSEAPVGDPIDVTGATAYLGFGSSQDDINLTATNGSATAGELKALGSITITATNGTASLHSAALAAGTPSGEAPASNAVTLSATGSGADVLIGDPAGATATGFVTGATSVTANADEDVTVNVAQPIELSSVGAGRNLSLVAPELTLDSLQGSLTGDIGIAVTDSDFAYAGALPAGGGVNVTASGALALGALTAQTGDITLGAGRGLTLGGPASASGTLRATAGGLLAIGDVTAGGGVLLEGGSVTAGSLTANGVDPSSGASVQVAAEASGGTVDVGSVTAPGDILLTTGANPGQRGGYASLTSVDFTGQGQTLTITAGGSINDGSVYLGYTQGGPTANGGAGPSPGVGSITGSGVIKLSASRDVDVDVLGDAVIASALGDNVYVTATGLAHVDFATSYGDSRDPIDVTGAVAYLGVANSQNQINVLATDGSATAGDLTSLGPVTVSATDGAAFLHSATLTPTPAYEHFVKTVTVSATGTGADVLIGGPDASGALGFVSGASAVTARADEDVTVDVGQPIALSLVSAGRNVSLTAPSLTLGALQGGLTGDLAIAVTADAFSYADPITVGGGVNANVAGALQLGSVTAQTGTITLAGASVQAASLSAQGIDATGASITATSSGANGANPGAAFVDIGSVAAPGNITLTAGDGYASLTSASFTGANGGAGQTLTLASTGSPQTVYLGYGQGGTGANGAQGGVTGAGAVELTSNGGVAVDTAGAVALDMVNARGAVNITADSVSANAVYNNADDFGATADGMVSLTARTGDIDLGTLEAVYGPVTLTAAGAVNAGIVVGQGINVNAGAAADIAYVSTIIGVSNDSGSYSQAYSTAAPVQITGAQVSLGQGFSYGPFTLAATNGAAAVGDIEFGGGAVSISAVNGAASLHSAGLEGAGLNFMPLQDGELPQPSASAISVTASGAGADVLIGGVSPTARFPGVGFVSGATSLTVQADRDVTIDVGGALALTSVQAGRNASVTADQLTLGALTAGQDASLTTPNTVAPNAVAGPFTGGPTLSATTVSAGEDLTIVAGGALSLGGVSAGRNLSLTAPSVSLAAVSGQPGGAISIDATAGGFTETSPLAAAAGLSVTAAGPVALGSVSAGGGSLDVSSQGAASVGDAAAAGGIVIAANGGSATLHSATLTGGSALLTVTASGAASDISLGQGTGSLQGGPASLQAGEDVIAAVTGPLTLTSAQAGRDLSLSGGALQAAALTSGRNTTLTAAGVSVGAGQVGGDLTVSSSAGATLGDITVGGALALDAAGLASLGSVSVTGAGRITAGDLDISTLLSAPTLTIEAANGGLTVGGATAPTDGSMWISEAEFSRLRAPTSLDLYAGSTAGTARGGLVVSDLSLDPTVTPKVSLYAAPGQTVSVTGAVTPTVSGGTLDIGSATDAAWMPSTILVSGSLGAATRVTDASFTNVHAFQQVTLSSGGDVLIGSARFFALVQATPANAIDINLNQPAGVVATGSEIGKVYVTTGQLNIDATGRVVQQNSSGAPGQYSGLYLLNGASTSRTALSINAPAVVDLFGSFVNASGLLTDGAEASRGSGLQLLGLPTGGRVPVDYRFNGCFISASAVCGVGDNQEAAFELLAQEFAGIAAATTDPQLLTQSVLLTVPPTAEVEEQVDPLVTGVGNEEIWRKRTPGEGTDR